MSQKKNVFISRIESDGNRFGRTEHNRMTFENGRGELIVEPIVYVNFSPFEVSLTVSSIRIRVLPFFSLFIYFEVVCEYFRLVFDAIVYRNCCESVITSCEHNFILFALFCTLFKTIAFSFILFFTELNDASTQQTHIGKKQQIENV